VDFKLVMYAYSDDQKNAMLGFGSVAADEDALPGGVRCIYADGTSDAIEAQDFMLRDEHHWRGWNCNAGIESLAIRADGEVFRAVCQQQGALGNLRDRSCRFPAAPIRCAKASCACLADIKISKWRDSAAAAYVPSFSPSE
jgi:hypothetical protein